MSKNQTMFFATADDISIVMLQLESDVSINYTKTGLFEEEKQHIYSSCKEIVDFGKSTRSTAVANPCYLLSRRGTPIRVEHVPQKIGGVLFAVDQLENPDTVSLRPGGRYGSDVILYGTLGTVSRSSASRELYTFAAKVFRKGFVRKEEFLVGPEAAELWRAGTRLTIGAESPSEFDLKYRG